MTKPTRPGTSRASIRMVLVALLACLGMLAAVPGMRAQSAMAAEVGENIITSTTLSSDTIRKNAPVVLHMEFRLPDNTIHEGDTSTITLPEGYDLDATPIKVSADSFTDEANPAQLTVTNKKTPEPTPQPDNPTPEPKEETPQPPTKPTQTATAQQKPKAAKTAKAPLAATGADSVAALSVALAALVAGLLIMRRLHKD